MDRRPPRQWLSDFHQQIRRYAETAYREYRSTRAYVDLLRRQGFTVEEGSAGMPTAFSATWGQGGPMLATFAGYDSVPGNSQQSVPSRLPGRACIPGRPGTPAPIPPWDWPH